MIKLTFDPNRRLYAFSELNSIDSMVVIRTNFSTHIKFSMFAPYKYFALAIHGQYLFEIRSFTQSSLIPLNLSHITNIFKLMRKNSVQ